MSPLQKITVVINRKKSGAATIADDLVKVAMDCGTDCVVTHDFPLPPAILRDSDAVCVIGGDGTLLGVVDQAIRYQVKILGINLGKLGFLVTHSPETIRDRFKKILAGDFATSSRTVLLVEHPELTSTFCLNDAVVRERRSRLLTIEVQADNQHVNTIACDGLIFATATGSTAYNLSAGGPILHPKIGAITMTPICPHTLSNRSFLFPEGLPLSIHCRSPKSEPLLSLDGSEKSIDLVSKPLTISTAPEKLQLIQEHNYDHFATVRTKLDWTETNR